MALADTAKLVASLELQDKFSRTADKFNTTLAGMEQRTSTLGRIGGQVSSGIGSAVTNLTRLGVIGVGILSTQVAAGIQTLMRLEEVTAATNAVIESTGGVANVTAEEVRNLAEKYESLNATMDDKVIQSGENVLLTFRAITEEAFEPALEAALNMNQALGGGEEGLQGTIIQIGKALQDPIRGLTALRRVGVQFTRAQEDQIKALVEANDLYGAQQLILEELGAEFGGAFAAAGDTAAGKFAKFKDSIEDAQAALATAFLPLLGKVSDKLTTLLADPATLASLESLGGELADAFDDIMEIAGNLPWDSIKATFEIMGTGSKALLKAFTDMPPWVQTAVLTGWGLNKLTGGALTGIAQTFIGALVGTRGSSPANPVFVSGTGIGGGTPGAGGPGTLATGLIGGAAVGGAVVGGISALEQIKSGTEEGVKSGFAALSTGPGGLIGEAVESVLGDPLGELVEGIGELLGITEEVPLTVQEVALQNAREARIQFDKLQGGVEDTENATQKVDTRLATTAQQSATYSSQRKSEAVAALQAQATAAAKLERIANKDFSPTVNVSTTVVSNVTISELQRKITSQQIAVGTGPLEFE